MFKLVTVDQQTWASGVSDAITLSLNNIGKIEQISFKSNNTDNAITYTLTINDPVSGQLYTKAAIPENATTVYLSTKATPDFPAFIVGDGCQMIITPSGDPGASGAEVDIVFGMEE